MELFKKSIILTKRYTRYGGDSESTLALVLDYEGVAYLFSDAENWDNASASLGVNRLFSITRQPEYVKWLFENSMDLLDIIRDDYAYVDFYNDRNIVNGRKNEFKHILTKIK